VVRSHSPRPTNSKSQSPNENQIVRRRAALETAQLQIGAPRFGRLLSKNRDYSARRVPLSLIKRGRSCTQSS
jgi:hypothetical protein